MKTTKNVIEQVLANGRYVTRKYTYFRCINAIYRIRLEDGEFGPWELVKILWMYQ